MRGSISRRCSAVGTAPTCAKAPVPMLMVKNAGVKARGSLRSVADVIWAAAHAWRVAHCWATHTIGAALHHQCR